MPQFKPGESKTATATFQNPKTAGFDYSTSLCMGTGWTVMASASFHLNAGQSKAVAFPVTMPTTVGTYPVYFKVTSGGVLIGTFAAEAVVIAAPVADIRVENLIITPSEVYVGAKVTISVTATNYGNAAGSKTIVCAVS